MYTTWARSCLAGRLLGFIELVIRCHSEELVRRVREEGGMAQHRGIYMHQTKSYELFGAIFWVATMTACDALQSLCVHVLGNNSVSILGKYTTDIY